VLHCGGRDVCRGDLIAILVELRTSMGIFLHERCFVRLERKCINLSIDEGRAHCE